MLMAGRKRHLAAIRLLKQDVERSVDGAVSVEDGVIGAAFTLSNTEVYLTTASVRRVH